MDEIEFGHQIESVDENKNIKESTVDELKSFLKDISESNEVSVMNVFCCNELPCYKCTNPPAWIAYAPKLLSNLFENFFQTLQYKYLLMLGENILKKLMKENEQFYDDIEKQTRAQSNSQLWGLIRCGRISGSTFKKICRTNINNPSKSLIKQIAYPQSIFQNNATKWGKNNETKAVSAVVKNLNSTHYNLSYENCGFIIKKNEPHLGASPDSLLVCDCHGKYPLEVKCPYNLKFSNNLRNDLLLIRNSYIFINENNNVELKKSHEYFYQVQLQIHVTQSNHGVFAIWCPKDLVIICVMRDGAFLSDRLIKAEQFFKKVILPEMIGMFYTQPRLTLSDLKALDFYKDSQKQDFYNYSLLLIDDKINIKIKNQINQIP